MNILEVLIQEATSDTGQEKSSELRRIYRSKLETLKSQLESLIQKKIRIDLEIRRTRKKLHQYKQQSETYVRTAIKLEGVNPDTEDFNQFKVLTERWNPDVLREIAELQTAYLEVDKLLSVYADLPLYGTSETHRA